MKTVSFSRTFFVEANVHAHIDVYLFKSFVKILEYTAIPLDIIIFLTHAG